VEKRTLTVLLIILIVAAPLGYFTYGYLSYSKVINPGEPLNAQEYIVIKTPTGKFYVMTAEEFSAYVSTGGKLPAGSSTYRVTVESYVTGSPVVDLNTTLRALYDSFTIILGDPSIQNCQDRPELYPGDCVQRTVVVVEVTAFVSNIFSTMYYLKARALGYNHTMARQYAVEETLKRGSKAYLTLWTKFRLGVGSLGNEDHLAVLLIGPAEGATTNRVFVPRKGLIVFEGTTEEHLRAEVVLVERLINFQWPGNTTK